MFIYLNHHKLKLLLKSFCQLIYFLGTMFLRSFPFCTKAITPAVHLAIFDVFTNQLNMLRHFLLSITRVYRHFIGGICHWVCLIGNKILRYFTILLPICISIYKSYKEVRYLTTVLVKVLIFIHLFNLISLFVLLIAA